MAAAKASATVGSGAQQHEVHGGLADALEDEGAEAAAADQRRHRGKPDILHQDDADAGQDDRKRQRQLDLPTGAGAPIKPMPRAASVTAAGTWLSPVTVLATTGSRE